MSRKLCDVILSIKYLSFVCLQRKNHWVLYMQCFLFQVAAELDRSDTARFLIALSAEANVADDSGMTALVLMISKMPSVVS